MPTYDVTDPDSGISLQLQGDSPPTESELSSIFSKDYISTVKAAKAQAERGVAALNTVASMYNTGRAAQEQMQLERTPTQEEINATPILDRSGNVVEEKPPIIARPKKPETRMTAGDIGYHGFTGGVVEPPTFKHPETIAEGLYNVGIKGASAMTSPMAAVLGVAHPGLEAVEALPGGEIIKKVGELGIKGAMAGMGGQMAYETITGPPPENVGQALEQAGTILMGGAMMAPLLAPRTAEALKETGGKNAIETRDKSPSNLIEHLRTSEARPPAETSGGNSAVTGTPEQAAAAEVLNSVEQARQEAIKAKEAENKAFIANPPPREEMFVTVNSSKEVPAASYVQVDHNGPSGNDFSGNPDTLKSLGYDIPSKDELLKLPNGQYKLDDAVKALEEQKTSQGTTEQTTSTVGEQPPAAAVPEPAIVGMGGATPAEFALNPNTPTSIKNAQVDVERQQRGLPPAVQPARKAFGAVWDEAMAKLDRDPGYQDRLLNELRDNPRALTDVEDATLLHRQIDLQNEYGKATRDLAQAYDDGRMDDVVTEQARVGAISDQLLDVYNIGKKVGTETGRGLAARKMMANEDFTLASMEMQKRAEKGGAPLTPEERTEVTRLHDKIAATQKAYDDYVAATDKRIAEMEADRAFKEAQAAAAKEPTVDPKVKSLAERIVTHLETRAEAASNRLREKLARMSAGVDPTILADVAEIGAAKIGRGALEFGKWSAEMVKDFGEKIKPLLEEGWKAANKLLDDNVAKMAGPRAERVKRAVKGADIGEQTEAAKESIKKKFDEGKAAEISPIVQKLARLFVEQGVKTRDELIDAVHGVLKEFDPEISRREAMDAISGYGQFKQLTKDEISVKLRDLKGQMQQVAKLEDITSKKPPLKTGLERRVPSDEERALIKQVNEAKRQFGIVVTDPETQLKSALDARKTYYRNQIADLEKQISTREKFVKQKTPSPTDAELELLKARRNELKEEFDKIFEKPGLTDEQRIKMAEDSLKRQIAEYERRIKEGDVLPGEKPKPLSTPELERLRAERETLKQQFEELRDANAEYQSQQRAKSLEQEKSALEKTIAEQERKLREGDLQPAGKQINRPADPTLEPLKQRRDALSKQIAEARKKPESQKYAESLQRRLEAMNKAIAAKEAKVAARDVSPQTVRKQNRPLPPELEMAQQKLEILNKQIQELRHPKLSPEERALKSLKTRLANQIKTWEDRLRRGDFEKKPRRVIQMDAEANRLHYENAKAKAAWHEALMKDRLARRTALQKIGGRIIEGINAVRAIKTSFDLSAVLRQGGFIAFSHPVMAAKAIPAMLRAFRSKEAQHAINQEILSRKNYPLYNQSKLYLSEHGQKLSQMEEAYMSRLAEKIPGVAASERAYVTFLNRIRADAFDAMHATLARSGELTPAESKAIANFINVATGRGNIGMRENALVGMNTIFFAPRYVASRFQLLAGQPLYRGTARTRIAVAKEYARFLAGVGVVYALGQAAGASIETDPRSSDFGKMKWGNTRLDPMAGLLQVSTLLSRLATGKTKRLNNEIVPIRGQSVPYGGSNAADVIASFARTKLAPVPGAIVDVLSGKNVVGQKVTPGSVAADALVPLSFNDIYQAMKEQGVPAGTALSILSIFGMGLQTYQKKHPQ